MAAELIEVTVMRLIDAPAETVFEAWLGPATAAKFLFATENGQIVRCEIDPEVGGEFWIVDRREDEDIEHMGEWVEIVRPSGSAAGRLAFYFSVNQSPVSRVTVDIAPHGERSELKLTHFMDAKWSGQAERARRGWSMILEGLAKVVV